MREKLSIPPCEIPFDVIANRQVALSPWFDFNGGSAGFFLPPGKEGRPASSLDDSSSSDCLNGIQKRRASARACMWSGRCCGVSVQLF